MLYLIELDSAYKIGFTKDLKTRISQYKTGSIIQNLISTREGNRDNEKELHNILKEYNITRELYEKNSEIIDIFNSYCFNNKVEEENKKLKEENEKLLNQIKILSKRINILTRELSEVYDIIVPELEKQKEVLQTIKNDVTNKYDILHKVKNLIDNNEPL